jgi:RNA polymerase sigma-70 factor (ECF subfamily)
MITATDEQLLSDCAANGSQDALAELYRRWRGKLFGCLYCRFGSPDDALDRIQETFLRIILKAKTFRGVNAYNWAVTIAINREISSRRRQQRHRQERHLQKLAQRETEPPASENIELAEECAVATEAFRQLGDSEREIIRILDVEEIDYEDAAEQLGIPVGTVRSRRHRAMKKLRQLMAALVLLAVGVCSGFGGVS